MSERLTRKIKEEIEVKMYNLHLKSNNLIIFHTIKDYNLDQIIEFDGYSIAPSIGITKDPKTVMKFGDIIFIGDKEMLRRLKVVIYDRDVWSPRLANVPDKIFILKPSEEVKRFLPNPKYKEFCDPDEGFYNFIDFIANNAFEELPRTKENISLWLRKRYKEIRGVDFFAPAAAIVAERIPLELLEEKAEEKLTDERKLDTEELSEKQWEVLHIMHRLQPAWNPFNLHDIAGDLLRPRSLEGFKRILRTVYGISIREANAKLKDIGGVEGLYKRLYEVMINIPSEYFEAKTLYPVDINEFHSVLVPATKPEVADKLKALGYRGEIIRYLDEEDLIEKLT